MREHRTTFSNQEFLKWWPWASRRKDGGLTARSFNPELGSKIHSFGTYLSILYKMLGTDTCMGTQVLALMERTFFGGGGIPVAKMQPLPSLSSNLKRCWDFWQEQGETATTVIEGTGFGIWWTWFKVWIRPFICWVLDQATYLLTEFWIRPFICW